MGQLAPDYVYSHMPQDTLYSYHEKTYGTEKHTHTGTPAASSTTPTITMQAGIRNDDQSRSPVIPLVS